MSRRSGSRSRTRRAPGGNTGRRPAGVMWELLELPARNGREARTLRFPSALGTLVRPNEWGKSTAVRGLSEVLFGPDASSRGGGVGRLTFVASDGVRYRLERDLATGTGALFQEEPSAPAGTDAPAWAQVANAAAEQRDGPAAVSVAGPAAAAAGDDLQQVLRGLLGLGERLAFEQSFCLSQPLPRSGSLSAEVQRLLVGAGRGGVERGLARLEEEALARSRHGGERGLPDGIEPGELERCEERIERLERDLREGRTTVDGAQGTARALAEAETRRHRHREEAERLEGEAERLRSYLLRRRAFEERRDALASAEQRLARAEVLDAEARQAHGRAAESWPELADAASDTEARLAALAAAERAVAVARSALEAAEATRAEASEAAAERARRLERHVARAPFQDDETLSVDAVRELRAGAGQAVTDWRAFLRREQEVAEARAALRPFAMLALAPEQDRALLRRYDYEAEARVRTVEGLEAAVREARAERRRLLVPDAALPNELEAEVLRAMLQGPRRRVPVLAMRVVAGGLLGVTVFWIARDPVGAGAALALGAVVAVAVAGLVRPAWSGAAQLRRFRGRSRAELEELLAHYDEWRAQPVPTRRDVLRLETEMEAARDQLKAFQRRMQPYQEAYPEPGAAFDAFRDGQRTLQQREEVHRELSSRTFGVEPGDVRVRSPLTMPSPWPRLAAFAEARGGRAQTVEQLCGFLAGVEDPAWDEVVAAAAGRDEARRAFRAERERLRREVAVAETVLEEREAAATNLRVELQAAEAARDGQAGPLEALLESTGSDVDELVRRWRERDQVVQRSEQAFDAAASVLDAAGVASLEELRELLVRQRNETAEERAAVEALAEGSDDLPAPDVPADRALLLDRLEALEGRIEMERSGAQAAEIEVFERTRELAALQAQPVVNLAAAEEDLAAARERRQALLEELEALATAHAELRAAVREFQGSYRDRLETLVSGHLRRLTRREDRSVRILDDFDVRVAEDGERELPPERLSQGAQDQLALALRLAIADHVADEVRLPLLLDDPFLHWDASRRERLREALQRAARERQVLLFSHDATFATWGEPIAVE